MNFKKILVVLLTLTMLLSAFAPTLFVFAEELQGNNNEDQELNYVSLGDSMSNGMGMPGYDETDKTGYLEVALNSYPSKFAAWLAGCDYDTVVEGQSEYTGSKGTVNLTQLATSGARAEDVYYILTKGTEDEIEPDEWTTSHFTGTSHPWDAANASETFRQSIADADVISYALGNCNFGAFLFRRLTNIIGFGDVDEYDEDKINYGHYTLENALALIEADEDLAKLVIEIYGSTLEDFSETGVPLEWVEKFAGYTSYTAASYIVTTIKIIDFIYQVNPDVKFMFVPLMNNALDFDIELIIDDETTNINAGSIISSLYTPINAYLSAYVTIEQMNGGYDGLTFYYADLPTDENGHTIQIHTYAQAFESLYLEVKQGEDYPESREFCHSRFIKDIRSFIFTKLFDSRGANFNKTDVREYEEACVNGPEALASYINRNPDKAKWIALYLGMVDALLEAIKARPILINVNDIEIDDFSDFSIYDLVDPVKAGLMDAINNNSADRADEDLVNALKNLGLAEGVAKQYASIPASSDVCKEEVSKDGLMKALLSLYGRSLLADGLAGHTSVQGHETISQSLINSYENEYTMVDESIDIVKKLVELLMDNPDVAYEFAYKHVDSEGYIDRTVGKLEELIGAVDAIAQQVENSVPVISNELKGDILVELDAISSTLEEIKAALESGDTSTLDGLFTSINALEDDFIAHVENASGIAAQAGLDISNTVEEAKRIFVDELVPTFIEMAEEFAYVAVDFLLSNIDTIYYNFPEIVEGIYAHVLEKALWLSVIVGEAVDFAVDAVIDAYVIVYDVLIDAYGEAQKVIAIADQYIHEIYVTLVTIDNNLGNPSRDYLNGMTIEECAELLNSLYHNVCNDAALALEMLKDIISDVAAQIEGEIPNAIAFYNAMLNVLGDYYDNASDVILVAGQIFSYVNDFMIENDMGANLKGHLDNIVDLIAETYRGTKDIERVGAEIYAYAIGMLDGTFDTEYIVTKDSVYVSLGNESYGEELASLLHLDSRYYNFALDDDYFDAIIDADIITIKLDNGEMMAFALEQVLAYGTELDWDAYLDAEGQAALDRLLAILKNSLIDSGIANELATLLQGSFAEYLEAFAGAGIDINTETVAAVLTYAVESSIYAYAELVDRVEIALDNVDAYAPDATVVITGMKNSLDDFGLGDLGIDISEYTDILDLVIDGFNVQLAAIAFAKENVIFVDSSDALDIYAALNVSCAHDYDDCEDEICNICGAKRVAPGHKYGDWKVVKEATVDEEGREERTCEVCGHVDARSIAKLTPEPAPAPAPEEPKNNPIPIIIAACIAVAAIAGFVVWKRKQTPTPDAPIDEEAPVEEAPAPDAPIEGEAPLEEAPTEDGEATEE